MKSMYAVFTFLNTLLAILNVAINHYMAAGICGAAGLICFYCYYSANRWE